MADGRKVLRSSIREFLCSEAMHHLKVPTTRAATCVVSSDRVVRDALYDGHERAEQCAVVSRLASSFIRFGSFENFRRLDTSTGKMGGCVGRNDLLHLLFDHTLSTLYPQIEAEHSQVTDPTERLEKRCVDFYGAIVERTARLVARWQTIGFCHGVLNTDNMSIVGLTLDYGPFAFVERFDPITVSNWSDSSGHYSFDRQPMICRWNLIKLAEMLVPLVSSENLLREQLNQKYEKVYLEEYSSEMRKKLGLTVARGESDDDAVNSDRTLIRELLQVLYRTGSDYTNCLRKLSLLSNDEIRGKQPQFECILNLLLSERVPLNAFVDQLNNELDASDLRIYETILRDNPDLLSDSSDRVRQLLAKKQLLREIEVCFIDLPSSFVFTKKFNCFF
jgi:uncharacterized protein YdiU (UPF0061 family)